MNNTKFCARMLTLLVPDEDRRPEVDDAISNVCANIIDELAILYQRTGIPAYDLIQELQGRLAFEAGRATGKRMAESND